MQSRISPTRLAFQEFNQSGQAGGVLLILCTLLSLGLADSALGPACLGFWHTPIAGLSVDLWGNGALMAIFFLLVGLELKRELVSGELSLFKNAGVMGFAGLSLLNKGAAA